MMKSESDGCLVLRSGVSEESTWRTLVLSDVMQSTASQPFIHRSSKTPRPYYIIIIFIRIILAINMTNLLTDLRIDNSNYHCANVTIRRYR